MSDSADLHLVDWQSRPSSLEIQDEFDVLQSRRLARQAAEGAQFSRLDLTAVVTAVSELAYNLLFHAAGRRKIVIGRVARLGVTGIQVVSEDEGPGIVDVSQALQDGFSTSGGLGGGLSGVRRLMDDFDIVSVPGRGTRIVARKWLVCR